MSKADQPKTATPRLRFPEFRDGDEWKFELLKTVGERVTERNNEENVGRVLTNSAEHGVLDQRDFFDKDIATAGKLDNYFVAEHGDYVYNPRISRNAPVGPISRNNIGHGSLVVTVYTVLHLGGDLNGFLKSITFATNEFFSYYLNGSCRVRGCAKVAQG